MRPGRCQALARPAAPRSSARRLASQHRRVSTPLEAIAAPPGSAAPGCTSTAPSACGPPPVRATASGRRRRSGRLLGHRRPQMAQRPLRLRRSSILARPRGPRAAMRLAARLPAGAAARAERRRPRARGARAARAGSPVYAALRSLGRRRGDQARRPLLQTSPRRWAEALAASGRLRGAQRGVAQPGPRRSGRGRGRGSRGRRPGNRRPDPGRGDVLSWADRLPRHARVARVVLQLVDDARRRRPLRPRRSSAATEAETGMRPKAQSRNRTGVNGFAGRAGWPPSATAPGEAQT